MSNLQQKALHFTSGESTGFIQGAAGAIELRTVMPEVAAHAITGVICHPHPLMGGTMDNKVVTTLARVFNDLRIPSIRFNFRGVGASEGVHAKGIGETEDLLTVLQWVKQERPNDQIWLAGFSFGTYVAVRAATQWPVAQLITIAPAIHLRDFKQLPLPQCPWLLIQGDLDDVVSPHDVYAWVDRMSHPPTVIRMPEAGHFFHGALIELRTILFDHLQKNMNTAP